MQLTNTMPSPRLASMVAPTWQHGRLGQARQVELHHRLVHVVDVEFIGLGFFLDDSWCRICGPTHPCTMASEMWPMPAQAGRFQRQFRGRDVDTHPADHDGHHTPCCPDAGGNHQHVSLLSLKLPSFTYAWRRSRRSRFAHRSILPEALMLIRYRVITDPTCKTAANAAGFNRRFPALRR